ncbi:MULTISPECIES: hypothetical protein [Rhodococcus]|uniref:DUF7144 family membrane protein n=1 Tax=Rhodococcus TaxID=1827 RepID=UPI00143ECDBA|nr:MULTISPECIES: hypothetical protein [Rhodococcus]QIX48321.1 hypothetical protein HFP48_01195 [Rhodococcus sp. DMU1]
MSEDMRVGQGGVSHGSAGGSSAAEGGVKQGIAAGTSIGAAIILTTVGILQLLQGIAAVAEDELFVVGQEYTFKFDFTAWGWVHIVAGAVVILVGIALLTGATWARVAAIVIAALSILLNFMWLPYYPWWSILIIALDVVVIWAVSTWNPRLDY